MDSNKSNNNSELNEVPREDTSAGNNISNDELMSSKKKRGNKNKIEHRKKQQKLREVVTSEFDSQLDSVNGDSPLILIELSTTEWKRLMPNAIEITNSKVHLQPDTHINKRKIFYNNIKYGSNISKNPSNIQTKTLAMKDESPKYVSANILNLHEIKKSDIAIVTDKHEVSNVSRILYASQVHLHQEAIKTQTSDHQTKYYYSLPSMIASSLLKTTANGIHQYYQC